jgi:hypothetical protein
VGICPAEFNLTFQARASDCRPRARLRNYAVNRVLWAVLREAKSMRGAYEALDLADERLSFTGLVS